MTVENPHTHSVETYMEIFILPDGISCSVSDENKKAMLHQALNVPVDAKMDVERLEDFFRQPELDILSDNVSICIENSLYQLIPSDFFRLEDAETQFELVFGKSEHDLLQYSILPKWNAHLVYRMPKKASRFFAERYPDAETAHHSQQLLKKFIKRTEDAVYLHVRKNAMDLALVKDHKLQLLNAFNIKTDEDICYFTLNVYEQFQLNTEIFPLKIKDYKYVNQSVVELLKQYVLLG